MFNEVGPKLRIENVRRCQGLAYTHADAKDWHIRRCQGLAQAENIPDGKLKEPLYCSGRRSTWQIQILLAKLLKMFESGGGVAAKLRDGKLLRPLYVNF